MESLYLIVRVAGDTVALRADGIGSVVEIDAISAVPRVPPHIRGLFALRSRILTVIDSAAALGPIAKVPPLDTVAARLVGL